MHARRSRRETRAFATARALTWRGRRRERRLGRALAGWRGLLAAALVLGAPSLALADLQLTGELERTLLHAPAHFAPVRPGAASDLPIGAFCPPRRSDVRTVLAHAASFAVVAGLAGFVGRRGRGPA